MKRVLFWAGEIIGGISVLGIPYGLAWIAWALGW